MSHYHDSDDLKLLGEMKTLAPVELRGFVALALKLFGQARGNQG